MAEMRAMMPGQVQQQSDQGLERARIPAEAAWEALGRYGLSPLAPELRTAAQLLQRCQSDAA